MLLSSYCVAQTAIDSIINVKRKELNTSGVDTMVCYYTYCIGSVQVYYEPTNSSCQASDIKYLLWSSGNQSFIQRFDECKHHSAVSISPLFMVMIKDNYGKLIKEKVLPPRYTYFEKGKRVDVTTSIDHSCHTVFEIYAGTNSVRKDIDDYNLEGMYTNAKHRNVNYLHNKKSLQNRLKVQIEAILKNTNILR
jgi:hypothetical protein